MVCGEKHGIKFSPKWCPASCQCWWELVFYEPNLWCIHTLNIEGICAALTLFFPFYYMSLFAPFLEVKKSKVKRIHMHSCVFSEKRKQKKRHQKFVVCATYTHILIHDCIYAWLWLKKKTKLHWRRNLTIKVGLAKIYTHDTHVHGSIHSCIWLPKICTHRHS